MNRINFLITVTGVLFVCNVFGGDSEDVQAIIRGLCSQDKSHFHDRKNEVRLEFDPEKEFENSKTLLGESSNGEMREVFYPEMLVDAEGDRREGKSIFMDWPTSVSVKKVEKSNIKPLEIVILQKVSDNGYGPAYYGCHLSANDDVYLVQEKLKHRMSDDDVLAAFRHLSPEVRLWFYKQLFKQAIALNRDGYLNNSIDIADMMFDPTKENLFIVDFWMAKRKDLRLSTDETGKDAFVIKRSQDLSNNKNADLYLLGKSIERIESKITKEFKGFVISR